VVLSVVAPIVIGVVLDRIGQIPNASPSRPDQILHRSVLQEGRLEGPFFADPKIAVRRASGSRPHLRNIAIASVESGRVRLGAHNPQTCIVQEAMGGTVAANLVVMRFVVFLYRAKNLLSPPPVEEIHELGGSPARIGRASRVLPILVVKLFPLSLES